MKTHELLGVGLRLLGAYFLLLGVFGAPELWHARNLPPDLAVTEVLVVALRVLLGQRLLRGGAELARKLERVSATT